MRIWILCLLFCGFGVAGWMGCAPAPPTVTSVTGVVFYSEEPPEKASDSPAFVSRPIAGAKVTFHEHGLPVGYGITDGLGRFRIRYYPPAAEPIDGLPSGSYAVTITKLSLVEKRSPSQSTPADEDSPDLPERYSHPTTTEWQALEVIEGQTAKNHFQLAVKK